MKTFDFGEYGMIDCMDSQEGDNFHDTHGDYVLLSDAQSVIDKLTVERDELLRSKNADKEHYAVFYADRLAVIKERDALKNWIADQSFEYDRAIHHNPDAAVWAKCFIQTFPQMADKEDLMLAWFANAMMAMHARSSKGLSHVD